MFTKLVGFSGFEVSYFSSMVPSLATEATVTLLVGIDVDAQITESSLSLHFPA